MDVGNKYNFMLKAFTSKGFSRVQPGCRSEKRDKVDWTIEFPWHTFVLSNEKALQGLFTVPGFAIIPTRYVCHNVLLPVNFFITKIN